MITVTMDFKDEAGAVAPRLWLNLPLSQNAREGITENELFSAVSQALSDYAVAAQERE